MTQLSGHVRHFFLNSESETLVVILQDQLHLKRLKQTIIVSTVQVPPLVPHWLSTMGCTLFSQA
jgi:hypothetical protein